LLTPLNHCEDTGTGTPHPSGLVAGSQVFTPEGTTEIVSPTHPAG
jgi:hypothetical protein